MRRAIGTLCLVLAAVAGPGARTVRAQPAAVSPGRIEVALGAGWVGQITLGSRDAQETTGTGGAFRLFASSTALAGAPDLEARVALRVTRAVDIEATGSYMKPDLRTRIDTDTELTNAMLTLTAPVHQFVVGGDLVLYPGVSWFGSRARLFVAAGGGYLRQLENDGALVVTGLTVDAGGGVKWLFKSRSAGWWKGLGARIDARALIRKNGVAFDDQVHVAPDVAASLFVRF
jgi:hypothetical protein